MFGKAKMLLASGICSPSKKIIPQYLDLTIMIIGASGGDLITAGQSILITHCFDQQAMDLDNLTRVP
jgi:hypothetical protein